MLDVNIEKILPVTEVRDSLNKIIDGVESSDDLYVVTKNGKPSAIIVGVHHLEKLTGIDHKEIMPDDDTTPAPAKDNKDELIGAPIKDTPSPEIKKDETAPIWPVTPTEAPLKTDNVIGVASMDIGSPSTEAPATSAATTPNGAQSSPIMPAATPTTPDISPAPAITPTPAPTTPAPLDDTDDIFGPIDDETPVEPVATTPAPVVTPTPAPVPNPSVLANASPIDQSATGATPATSTQPPVGSSQV